MHGVESPAIDQTPNNLRRLRGAVRVGSLVLDGGGKEAHRNRKPVFVHPAAAQRLKPGLQSFLGRFRQLIALLVVPVHRLQNCIQKNLLHSVETSERNFESIHPSSVDEP